MSTEVMELATGRVTPGPDLSEGEYKLDSAITALDDGRVVIAGGQRVNVFDPAERDDDSAADSGPAATLVRHRHGGRAGSGAGGRRLRRRESSRPSRPPWSTVPT
jgi:hypothetical protein